MSILKRKITEISDDELKDLVKSSNSLADLMEFCGYARKTSSSKKFKERIEKLGYSTIHWVTNGFSVYKICNKCKMHIQAANFNRHTRSCKGEGKVKDNRSSKTDKYKLTDGYKCICGRKFKKSQSFYAHLSWCTSYKNITGDKDRVICKGTMHWDNFSEEKLALIREKSRQSLLDNIKSGKTKPHHTKHTESSKQKIREGVIKYLKEQKNFTGPRYNHKACEYIESLNKSGNFNFQHAENGGEFSVCGYFVDGYDKERNIVIEYDEPRHYKDVKENILRYKDIVRQKCIISALKCKFFRYNEKLKLLYSVTDT